MAQASYGDLLRTVIRGDDLTAEQADRAFAQIMDGEWSEARVAGLLVALACKGEAVAEIVGAARAMRAHAVRIDTGGAEVIDIVGTGGTGLSTFNISTATALVCAGAGLKVAKHGNRTNTRASGSADVLAALGVNLDAAPETVSRCLAEAGVCFCFAVKCHPAMKHAVGVRKALGIRTIFNVLGPPTNPAGAKRQLMGVFDDALTEPLATVLGSLGVVRAMVVHGSDGLDEISNTSETRISELRSGAVSTRTVQPEDFGLQRADLASLQIDSPEASAAAVRGVLSGGRGAKRDIVVLNAAAALAVADRAETIAAAMPLAEAAIDDGAAAAALDRLIRASNA